MNAIMICLAAATLGSDVGWELLPDGGMEYVIQLDPQTLESIKAGSPFQSTLHPDAGDNVRSYRIVVGKGKLRRDAPAPRLTMQKKPNPEANPGKELLQPPKLAPNPAQKPMPDQQAVFEEPENKPSPAAKTTPAEPSKPWLPLMLTILALFASIGANVYLGWIAWESRQRCRAALAALSASGS